MKRNINDLKENLDNPRTINEHKFEQIKKSLKDFPEMIKIRPIVINTEGIILGGNMRWRAAKELGWTEIECVVLENKEKEYEFLVKDNLSYGDWQWTNLVEDYNSNELTDWGIDIPVWFKDLENSLVKTDYLEKVETINEIEKKPEEKPTATKKALYLFYSTKQKKEILDLLDGMRNERTNEQIFMDIIKICL